MKTEHDEFRGFALGLALPKLLVGLAIVAAGVLFALDNLGWLNAGAVLRFWPVLMVLIGLVKVVAPRPGKSGLGGWVLMIVGGLLLSEELFTFDLDFDDFWPLILVLVGGWLVLTAWRGPRRKRGLLLEGAEIKGFALMGGNSLGSASQDFRGGELAAAMGGLEVDLRGARPVPEGAVVEVFAMWGGIELHVPEGWLVESQVLPVMAVYEDQTRPPVGTPTGKLLVRGLVLMGGVEVNHKAPEE